MLGTKQRDFSKPAEQCSALRARTLQVLQMSPSGWMNLFAPASGNPPGCGTWGGAAVTRGLAHQKRSAKEQTDAGIAQGWRRKSKRHPESSGCLGE
jgi:hypothetical protein